MSEQEKKEEQKKEEQKKRLWEIVKLFKFKDSAKYVSDLKALLESTSGTSGGNAPTDNEDEDATGNEGEDTTGDESAKDEIANYDALVVLTFDALLYAPDETGRKRFSNANSFIEGYYVPYKIIGTGNGTTRAAYQRIYKEDYKIQETRQYWADEFSGKIHLNTELTKVLEYIEEFTDKFAGITEGKSRRKKFKDFLATFKNDASMENPNRTKDVAMTKISDAIKNSTKKCVIFTGAPGTGKTYCVEEYVDEKMGTFKKKPEAAVPGAKPAEVPLFDRKEYFVQFHSSYDYTDFVEGLRPIKNKKGKMEFVRMDGIFKAFCRKVAGLNKAEKIKKSGDPNAVIPQTDKQEESGTKEAPAKTDEGINGKNTYYFVIDEINRADLGRVFGELMYCFEKRGKAISTQYKKLPTYTRDENGNPDFLEDDGCFKNGFYIPENVIIIGTMNDIDRSVETFDFALRRRFDWVEIEATEKVMETSLEAIFEKRDIPPDIRSKILSEIVPQIEKMNLVIDRQSGLGKEFRIGPAYFKDYDVEKEPEKALTDIWERNIEPILKEYVRGRQSDDGFIRKCKKALGLPSGEQDNKSQQESASVEKSEPDSGPTGSNQ